MLHPWCKILLYCGAHCLIRERLHIPGKLLKNHNWPQIHQSALTNTTICNKKDENWIFQSTTAKRSVKLLPTFTTSSSLYNGFLLQTSNILLWKHPIDVKMSSAYKTSAGYIRERHSMPLEFCIFLRQCSTFWGVGIANERPKPAGPYRVINLQFLHVLFSLWSRSYYILPWWYCCGFISNCSQIKEKCFWNNKIFLWLSNTTAVLSCAMHTLLYTYLPKPCTPSCPAVTNLILKCANY